MSPCAVVSHALSWGVRYPGTHGVGCDLSPYEVIPECARKSGLTFPNISSDSVGNRISAGRSGGREVSPGAFTGKFPVMESLPIVRVRAAATRPGLFDVNLC